MRRAALDALPLVLILSSACRREGGRGIKDGASNKLGNHHAQKLANEKQRHLGSLIGMGGEHIGYVESY